MNKQGLKIASINGAEVLKLKEGLDGEIKYNTVFSNSLLLDKLKKVGLDISKQGSTKDIINVKFDYGYTDEETKEAIAEYNNIKANNKNIKKDNKESINRIKQLGSMIEKAEKELETFNNDLITLKDENEKIKLQKKINTRENKIPKYKEELDKIDTTCIDEINNNVDSIKELEKQITDNTYKKEDLRDLIYEEGFSLDIYKTVKNKKIFDKTIVYVYWFRSAGKAKDGTDYFINKKLFDEIDEWQRMGIKLPEKNAKLVEMEVYKSLIASALINSSEEIDRYLVIKPSEILIVKDLDCYSEPQDVIKVVRDDNTGLSKAVHIKEKCKNTIWDGMALLQGGQGFRGLRHHFYKSAGFCCDFQQYFKDFYKKDYETATITDMFEREVKVSTIKMIASNNAIKWIKFLGETKEGFEQWSKYIEENGCKFGVCKENHVSKYGDKQRMSLQMVQTLPINKVDIKNIFEDSKNYITKLQNDDNFFIDHLKRTASEVNSNALLVDLATTYPTFVNSYMFKDVRKKEINDYKETLKRSKLLSIGENETILANPLLLLEYCTSQLDEYIKDGVISGYVDETLPEKNSCYCKRFKQDIEICAMRSPHNSGNNIMMFKNNINEDMDKYFSSFGVNVIAVNMLYNDIQDRGNGLDEDLDFVYCSINKTIVEAGKKAQIYPTIVNGFKKKDNKYDNTKKDLAIVDNILQNSQKAIGTSSNVAMLYLTQYWHLVNQYKNDEDEKAMKDYNYYFIEGYKDCRTEEQIEMEEKLLDNVCILSVLAQCSIDASKRSFIVGKGDNGLNKEIERLRKELPCTDKPTFWQYTSSTFKNDEIEKKLKNKDKEYWKALSKKDKTDAIKKEKEQMIENLYDYECPANWVLKEIDVVGSAKYGDRISDENFLVLWGNKMTQDRKQAKKIEEVVEQFQNECSFLNSYEDENEETINLYYNFIYKEYLDKVYKYSISLNTMSLIIARTLDVDNKFLKSNKKIKTKMLNVLYKHHRDDFIKCFRDYEPTK